MLPGNLHYVLVEDCQLSDSQRLMEKKQQLKHSNVRVKGAYKVALQNQSCLLK